MDEDIRDKLAEGRVEEAFELLLRRYQHKVFRLACAITGSEAAAEDAAQEAFIRVWKGLRGFRGGASLSTWIYSIARNASLTVRKQERSGAFSLEPPLLRAAAASCASPDWERLIAALPENYRQVIRLYYMEDRSYEEVAAMLALPLGTVKTYLHRARKQLAQALRATLGENYAV